MNLTRNPLLLFALSFLVLALSAKTGIWLAERRRAVEDEEREGFGVVQSATLTLLGLIVGFTFQWPSAATISEGTTRKQRPTPLAQNTCELISYRTPMPQGLALSCSNTSINTLTAKLQAELWATVRSPAGAPPTPLLALVISGMNDVLNSQGYTQAAWWNRIPIPAWTLMVLIAICAIALVGYGGRSARAGARSILVLPLVVSIAFFLIADIDSPRGGLIRVRPQNLLSLAESFRAH